MPLAQVFAEPAKFADREFITCGDFDALTDRIYVPDTHDGRTGRPGFNLDLPHLPLGPCVKAIIIRDANFDPNIVIADGPGVSREWKLRVLGTVKP